MTFEYIYDSTIGFSGQVSPAIYVVLALIFWHYRGLLLAAGRSFSRRAESEQSERQPE